MSETAGRYYLREHAQLILPGNCISCGTASQDRKYIDLEIDVEFYGRVYFCTDCFAVIASDLLFVPKSSVDYIEEIIEKISKTVEGLKKENEVLKHVVVAVLTNRYPDADNVQLYFDQLLSYLLRNETPAKPTFFIPKQSSGSNESGSFEGSDDVHPTPAHSDDGDSSGTDSDNEE